MKHLFVSYSVALILKEKGYNELCLGWWCWINGTAAQFYDYKISNQQLVELNNHPNNCSAPLYQQVVAWINQKFYEQNHGLMLNLNYNGMLSNEDMNEEILVALLQIKNQ